MHALKLSSSSAHHQYHQVPLDAESDSADDEMLLYSAPSLNDPSSLNLAHGNEFSLGGDGLHDPSQDLRVKPQFSGKRGQRRGGMIGPMKLRTVFPLCLMVVIMMVTAVVVVLFLLVVNYDRLSSSNSLASSATTLAPTCFPVPKPIDNSGIQSCDTPPPPITTTSTTATATTAEKTTPPPPPPTESSEESGGNSVKVNSEQTETAATDSSTAVPVRASTGSPPPPPSLPPPLLPSTEEPVKQVSSTYPSSDAPSTLSHTETEESTLQPTDKVSTVILKPVTASNTFQHPDEEVSSTSQPPKNKVSTVLTQPVTDSNTPYQDISSTLEPSTADLAHEKEASPTGEGKLDGGSQSNTEGSDVSTLEPTTSLHLDPSCFPVPKPLPGNQIQPCHTPPPTVTSEPSPPTTNTGDSPPTMTSEPSTSPPIVHSQPTPLNTHSDPGSYHATPTQKSATPLHWEHEKNPAMSESSPQLFDLDGDGLDDVLVIEDTSPCGGEIVGLSGRDGSVLWHHPTHFAVFAVRCILDVNSDGHLDCLLSGRTGGFLALDSRDGAVLWSVDSSIVFQPYNFYFPLVVGDLDGDGTRDLINTHGGDVTYPPEQHDRSPAFLVAVSGRTGQSLMEPMQMPDGHESYSSPVLFSNAPPTMHQEEEEDWSNQFVLFGSGGETVAGSLWAVQLESLRERVRKHHALQGGGKDSKEYVVQHEGSHACQEYGIQHKETGRPVFNTSLYDLSHKMDWSQGGGSCPELGSNMHALWNAQEVCLYEVVRTLQKGVILPPVMVDLSMDGVSDLVVSTFDGRTIVLDGRDLSSVLWEVAFPSTESYSVPAPLFYTEDDIPDLVIRTNVGEWSDYNVSTVRVLDGSDGSLLWSFDSANSAMMSSISVVSETHGRDALVFFNIGTMKGEESGLTKNERLRPMKKEVKGQEPHEDHEGEGVRVSRQLQDVFDDPPDLWESSPDDPAPDPNNLTAVLEYCGWSRDFYTTSLYMVTREMVDSGMDVLPLVSYEPFVLVREDGDPTSHPGIIPAVHSINRRHGDHDQPHPLPDDVEVGEEPEPKEVRCSRVSKPTDLFTTPLLGDFDLDGQLDIAFVVAWSSIYTQSLKTLVVGSNLERLFVGAYGKGILDFDTFLPFPQQPWTQYMGRHGDNVFTIPLKT